MGQVLETGIAMGSLYSLMALGMVLIFRTTNVVNFAQGAMAMMATYIAFALLASWHWPVWAALAGSLVSALLLGALIDRVFMDHSNKPSAPIASLIITLGLYSVLEGLATIIWGANPAAFPWTLNGIFIRSSHFVISTNDAVTFAITLILVMGLFALLRWTRIGLAMRAMAQDAGTAQLMGISLAKISSSTWALGSALGAVSALFLVPITYLQPTMMDTALLLAFSAAVLGGFSNLPGTLLGGLIVGVLESMVGVYISNQLQNTVVFALIIIVLYLRPQGLLGRHNTKKV